MVPKIFFYFAIILQLALFTPARIFSATKSNSKKTSTCYETTQKGRLKNGVKLSLSGSNYQSYSKAASYLGRTYVHSQVKTIWENAMKSLARSDPQKVFVYAETGFQSGGKFRPHKTHQNGLSIDIMVPVIKRKTQKSIPLPTSIANK